MQAEKRSFGLLQAVSLTTAVADTMEQQRVGVIRIIQVGIAVRFVGGEPFYLEQRMIIFISKLYERVVRKF